MAQRAEPEAEAQMESAPIAPPPVFEEFAAAPVPAAATTEPAIEPRPVAEPVSVIEHSGAEAPAPVTEARAERGRVVAPPPAPAIDIGKALQESGLVMIQTDPSKVTVAEPVEAVEPAPARPRPRRAPPSDSGPLELVETRKDA